MGKNNKGIKQNTFSQTEDLIIQNCLEQYIDYVNDSNVTIKQRKKRKFGMSGYIQAILKMDDIDRAQHKIKSHIAKIISPQNERKHGILREHKSRLLKFYRKTNLRKKNECVPEKTTSKVFTNFGERGVLANVVSGNFLNFNQIDTDNHRFLDQSNNDQTESFLDFRQKKEVRTLSGCESLEAKESIDKEILKKEEPFSYISKKFELTPEKTKNLKKESYDCKKEDEKFFVKILQKHPEFDEPFDRLEKILEKQKQLRVDFSTKNLL